MDLHFLIPIARAAGESTPSGPAAAFNLNIKLFVAQLINFAIVLFVLWKWVFIPVAKKLTERTERIEKAMADANSTEKEKQEFAVWKQQEMTKTRQEASSIVTAAQLDATKARDQIMQQTKEDQQKFVDQAKKQIEQEKNQQLASAKAEMANLITMATEKILRQKLDGKKDEELIKNSLENLK
jgi:F-type H+-transporting ATPase subunit b